MHPESDPFRGSGGETRDLEEVSLLNETNHMQFGRVLSRHKVAACYVVWGMARLERR